MYPQSIGIFKASGIALGGIAEGFVAFGGIAHYGSSAARAMNERQPYDYYCDFRSDGFTEAVATQMANESCQVAIDQKAYEAVFKARSNKTK